MYTNIDYYKKIFEAQNDTTGGVVQTKELYDPNNVPPTGDTMVSANSIQLAAGASSVDNYYEGYDIILRASQGDGSTYVQRKKIVAYDGTSKTAVIEDVWDKGYEPNTGNTYEIVLGYQDKRVSINPVMQLADYISSVRYGRGFDPEDDFFLNTWIDAARKCDARSDVSIKLTSSQSMVANDVYELVDSGRIVFEGRVRTTESTLYVNFTDVIGKITNKWKSWKSYLVGDIVYTEDDRFYKVTVAGIKTTKPTHSSGTVNGLQSISSLTLNRKSGSGPASLAISLNKNPVLALNEDGAEISGYSLYDADSISYWRRLGWDEHSQDWATLYQTNFTIDTSTPLFDNINMMLEHCNGIFSYSEGRYAFSIEDIEDTFIDIGLDDIIGKIQYKDSGTRTAYNSITVSYIDPGNNFESRNISLFSKRFLKQDRNVPKKGNITVAGMTNYYNVRLLADSYLKKSRYSGTITMTLVPEYITLVPGSVIQIDYPRFNWTNKKFRVDTMTINEDCTIQVVAKEYNQSFYSLTNMATVPAVGEKSPSTDTVVSAPTSIIATSQNNSNELKDGVLLSWTNVSGLSSATDIEIYQSDVDQDSMLVNSISSSTNLTFQSPHNLSVGSKITATKSGNGILKGKSYYVKSVVSASIVTLSENLGGVTASFTNGVSLSLTFNPFSLVGSVAYPGTSFLHTFPDITASTTKYYKIRYKIRK